MIGQMIAHYTILEKLGEGGMGVVYKAEDTKLDRMVALKFLPPHLAASVQDKARFIQEAKAASAINHPNICTIYSIDDHDGQMFIVMEFIDGQTLREKKDAVSFKQAVEIGIQISDGLAAAHEKGIVHRDIKPENIMIRKDGIAQIMDFGLAKLRSGSSKINRLTKEGSTVGTAGYMSPEQIQGQDADHRSDIFSLGVLLYELFTGQLPFKGVHETALAYEIVNVDPAPMSAVVPEIDPTLDAIVLECLEKDPNERMQSVKQVAIDLKKFKRESSRQRVSRVTAARPALKTSNRPVQATSNRQYLWPAITGLLIVALLGAGWMLWHKPTTPRPIARFVLPIGKDQSVGIADHPVITISPDGSRIVYVLNGKIFQRHLDSFVAEPIPGTEDGTGPFFSPDGRWIGFFAGGKLKKVPVSGGAVVEIAEAQNNRGGAWGMDGSIIFTASGRGGLSRVKEDGGEVQQLTSVDTTQNERTHRWPSCLPDGKTVMFTLGLMGSPDYYEDASIVTVNLASGQRKLIMKGASSAQYVPSGYLLWLHLGTLFAAPFSLSRLEITGSSFPVVENVAGDMTTGAGHYAVSESGTLAYLPGLGSLSDRTLAFIDLKGAVSTLPVPEHAYVDPRLSPDGRRIAVGMQSGKDFDIWVYDLQRNSMSRLTFGGSNRSPVWSPDGRRIAYADNTAGGGGSVGRAKVVVIPSDGGGATEEIVMDYDRTYVNCWTRDGSSVIVTAPQPGKGWDLWVVPISGGRKPWVFLSTKFDESFASISPDGKWISYLSNETGVPQVYVRPFPSGEGKWQISSELSTRADWSADGRRLYFSSAKGILAVPITGTQSLTAGPPVILLKDYRGAAVESGVSYDISPDGQHILVTRPKEGDTAPLQVNLVMNWFDEIEKLVSQGR